MRIFLRPIFWILVFALLLRLWGIDYGFPLFLVNDEPALVLGALKMIELKTLIPAWHEDEFRKVLSYPPLASYFYLVTLAPVIAVHYVLLGFPPLGEYKDIVALDPSFLWIAARIINALMGLGVIFIAYLTAKKITRSERASLLAALFLAVSFYHIQLSQVVRHWMPASLLLYLAWLSSINVRETNLKKPYFLSGLFTGLAAGVNTSSAIGLLPGFFFHLARHGESFKKKIFSSKLWLMIVTATAIAIVFVALYPYGLTRGEGTETVGGDIAHRLGFFTSISFKNWFIFLFDYFKLLWRYETTMLIASLIGFAALIRRAKVFSLTALVFSVAYLSLLYLFFNEIPRALIFILPIMAVFAGYGLDRLILRAQNHFRATALSLTAIFGLFFLAFFAYPLLIDLRYDYLLAKPDTRLVAKGWIEKNIPEGAKILGDFPYLRLINTKNGIAYLEKLDPSGLRSQDRVLAKRNESNYPAPAYFLLNLHFLSPNVPERITGSAAYFKKQGFKYLIVEYKYADKSDLYPFTADLVRDLRLVKRFQSFSSDDFGRSLDITGEIATVEPLDLFKFDSYGQIIDIYEL